MRGSSPHGRGKREDRLAALALGRLIPAWAGKTGFGCHGDGPFRAHPRMGGENAVLVQLACPVVGSSPHGRGKRVGHLDDTLHVGLIPAWAGKTSPGARGWGPSAAHPRMGGENASANSGRPAVSGSSPHGRGKRHPTARPVRGGRLIPAWAGKTQALLADAFARAAHPRMGGENPVQQGALGLVAGSSPHGRGKRVRLPGRLLPGRLIPAWAGKTLSAGASPSKGRAHPRMGGENCPRDGNQRRIRGSSPHGRGKPSTWTGRPSHRRLIPAWAGKTRAIATQRGWRGAHPRMGGENRGSVSVSMVGTGSSPHGRGKHKELTYILGVRGLIPAWAGTTALSGQSHSSGPAHPRMGGENGLVYVRQARPWGSSPHGRGKH